MKKESVFRVVLILAIAFLVIQFGFLPVLSKDFYRLGRHNNSWAEGKIGTEKGKYDVVVAGDEPEGITAAVSAARLGAKTLLLCEGSELGSSTAGTLHASFESSVGIKGELLCRGILQELQDKLGEKYSVEKYQKAVQELVKDERNIETVYNASIGTAVLQEGALTALNVTAGGKEAVYAGRRFIDATWDGKVLLTCGAKSFTGSADISLPKAFMPVSLNFILDGVDVKAWEKESDGSKKKIEETVNKFNFNTRSVRINSFDVVNQGEGKVLIEGVEVNGLDVMDQDELSKAFVSVSKEIPRLTEYLSKSFTSFKNARLNRIADRFYIPESRHFIGEHVLGVNEVLEDTDYDSKIAIGSAAVEAEKLADSNLPFIIGKPSNYGIPLGCIIPLRTDNLLMVGRKVSYSSLAATSAGRTSVSMTEGEAAGVVAVYSLTKGIKPRSLLQKDNAKNLTELSWQMKKQGIYLPKLAANRSNEEKWSYPSVRKLNSLGLLSGGTANNYRFESEATQREFAMLLLNGIYRVSPDQYSLDFDKRLRTFFNTGKLTQEKAAEILISLYSSSHDVSGDYERACSLGYVDGELQQRLKDRAGANALTMNEVYRLSTYTIEKYTGKKIPE